MKGTKKMKISLKASLIICFLVLAQAFAAYKINENKNTKQQTQHDTKIVSMFHFYLKGLKK